MNIELWKKCVDFHGHECPGVAVGFRACEIVKEKMDLDFSADEELVCITENDACAVDAVQYITGCTMGKGNLIYRDLGKMAFSFFSRRTNESVRIILKKSLFDMESDEKMRYFLQAPAEEIFDIRKPTLDVPKKARLFNTVVCDNCHEATVEHKVRLNGDKKLCLDCSKEYSRGW